jgi:hypothetical protein
VRLLTALEPHLLIIRRGYDDPPGRSTLEVSNNTTTPCIDTGGILMYHGIPAKRCRYEGVQFRSLAEASWARALEHMGFFWHYEPQTYAEVDKTTRLQRNLYTPDFIIYSADDSGWLYLEVKGTDDQLADDRDRMIRSMTSLNSPLRAELCAGLLVVPPYYNIAFRDDERLMFSRMSYDKDRGFYYSSSILAGYYDKVFDFRECDGGDYVDTVSKTGISFQHPSLRSPYVYDYWTTQPLVACDEKGEWALPRKLAETYKTSGEITYLD